MVRQVIEGTILLIIIFLVLSNGKSFTSVVGALSAAYGNSVKVLQGRG